MLQPRFIYYTLAPSWSLGKHVLVAFVFDSGIFNSGIHVCPGFVLLDLAATPVFFHEIRPPSGARGMTFDKFYDWAKENDWKMSRAKRPML